MCYQTHLKRHLIPERQWQWSRCSRVFWVSSRNISLQKRVSCRVLNYQLNFKPMNHAISNQNNHQFRVPKPDSHPPSSWDIGKAMVFRNSSQSGGLEFAIYNSLYLKDSHTTEYSNAKQAESWTNAWMLWSWFPLYLPNSPYSLNKGWSSLYDRQWATLYSTISLPLVLPPVKQQCDSSDTEQLPPESLLSGACESLSSTTPCTMSHLPFMLLRAFKSLQSSSGGMQRGNSKPPTSKLFLQFWGYFLED